MNRSDVTTLEEVVETMEQRYGKANRIWVLDRGMILVENLEFLRLEGRRHIVGTPRGMLRTFETDVFQADDDRAMLVWKKVEAWRDWVELSEGSYLLRSNVSQWSEEKLWRAYMQLTDAEEAFSDSEVRFPRVRALEDAGADRSQGDVAVGNVDHLQRMPAPAICVRVARAMGRLGCHRGFPLSSPTWA